MRFKATYLSLIILVFLILTIIITEKSFNNKKKDLFLFPKLNLQDISKITIINKDNNKVIMEKKTGKWLVVSSLNYAGDKSKIEDMLKKVKKFSMKNKVSVNPAKKSFYGFDKDYLTVNIYNVKDKELASFFIGKNGPDFYSTYIQKKGSSEVILINEYLKSIFDKESIDWRNHTIFNFNPQEVKEITMNKEGKEIVISLNKDEEFEIIKPERSPAKNEIIRSILDDLSNFNANSFYLEKDLKVCNLEKPLSFIRLVFKNGLEKELLIGAENKNNQYYVKKKDDPTVFLVSKYRIINDLFRELKDLESKNTLKKP
ncbi:MAG: DUF4340 domain-containing protein [bacterium]|nr:DUF4340 domain-containing protein [bacterium]